MNEIFEKLLQDFKKANKAAREKMAAKFGFRTPEAFESHLKGIDVKPTREPKKKFKRVEVTSTPVTPLPIVEEKPTDMVIAFDTTGSMRSYIAAVRKHVRSTIESVFDNVPNLKLKLVAFGDYCDMTNEKIFGNAYQETALTDNMDQLIEFVHSAKETGGGDTDEFYELVLKKILDETPWREEANKTILLIGDCNPHEIGYSFLQFVRNNKVSWREEARKAAKMGVKIDTLRIIPGTMWYAELSTITNGTCMDFKSADKTQDIVTGSTYFASGSERSIRAAKVVYKSALERGDTELSGAYKGMAADRGINLDE